MEKEYILNINDITFGYTKEKLIYENFSLELKKGQVVSIVGPSGSGKSTLFELVTKNLTPIKGKIDTKKVSSIYQDPYSSFHPTYNIYEQISDVVEYMDEEEITKILDDLNLKKELLFKKPHELSGGQLQRCSILRAVLMKPDLLLADEPTSALDNITALETMQMLIKFLDRFGILLITHDPNLAKWCSDEIINIEKTGNKI